MSIQGPFTVNDPKCEVIERDFELVCIEGEPVFVQLSSGEGVDPEWIRLDTGAVVDPSTFEKCPPEKWIDKDFCIDGEFVGTLVQCIVETTVTSIFVNLDGSTLTGPPAGSRPCGDCVLNVSLGTISAWSDIQS